MDARLEGHLQRLGRARVKAAVSTAQELVRSGQLSPDELIDHVVSLLPATASSLRAVINATGVLLHTNLGRAPLSPAATRRASSASGASLAATSGSDWFMSVFTRGTRHWMTRDANAFPLAAAKYS